MKNISINKRFLKNILVLILFLLSGTSFAKTGFTSATVSGAPTTICTGNSVGLSLNVITCFGGGGSGTYTATYQWEDSPDNTTWTAISGATNSTYTASPTSDTYYRCVITITGTYMGCGVAVGNSYTTAEALLTVTPIPAQPGAISGSSSVLPSTSGLTYSITAVADATSYTWTVPVGWTIDSGQGTTSISVTSGTTGQDGDITVNASNSCGTSANQTLAVTILGDDCPESTSIAPTSSQTLCVGDASTQLTATVLTSGGTGAPTIQYQWYYNTSNSNTVAGATLISGATSQNYSPLTTVSEIGTRWYFCVGYATDNNCGQTNTDQTLASNAVEIIVNNTPVTPGAISGNTSVDPSTSGLIYSITAVSDATSYTWTVPTGWTIDSGQGTTSISVTSGITGQDGDITVASYNTCGTNGSTSSTTVTVNIASDCPSSTAVAPSTTQTHCVGDVASQLTATISTSGGAGTPTLSYQWYYNTSNSNTIAGATLISGATSQNYTPLTSSSEVGSRWYFCVGYATDNSCGQTNTEQSLASNTVEITVNDVPAQPGAVSGSSTVNSNTSGLNYSISAVSSATSYTWTVPTGWTLDSGQGTTSISVTSGNLGEDGNITVTASNSCGTSSVRIFPVNISNDPQAPTITLNNNTSTCEGSNADLTYSATTENPDLYSIDYNTSANLAGFVDVVDAVLTASPIVLASSGIAEGIYYGNLTVKNSSSGLSSDSYLISVDIIATPSQPGAISGVNPANENTSYTYTIASVSGATTYTWTVPTGWIIDAGQGTTSIDVTSGAAGQNGNITVNAGNSCGTSANTTLAITCITANDHSMYDCNACHIFHTAPGVSLTNAAGNALLCQSCHVSGGNASTKPMPDSDKAVPGVSGNSHSWSVSATNSTYEALPPSDAQMALRVDNGDIVCSTCHNQHNPNTYTNYLRISNTGDALCKNCHSARDVGRYTDVPSGRGSHPVGIAYNGGTGNLKPSPTGSVITVSGNIECSSCHQTHYAATNDGYLLRQTNDAGLCTECHDFTTPSHNGMDCKVCHQTHNTSKTNIYMIRDIIATPNSGNKTVVFTALSGVNSFADGDATYDGVCEVCHTSTSYHTNTDDGVNHNDANNCTNCHYHNEGFTANCVDCHVALNPAWNTTDAHVSHTKKYDFDCSTCHFGNNHDDGTVDVAFDPNGLATRNGNDATTPSWDGTSCSNVYCHSNGRTAYRGTNGTDTWSATIGSQTATYANPTWTSSITACSSCHSGTGNMNSPYTITLPGLSSPSPPSTGSHTRLPHLDNDQELSGNGWTAVNCFWCHNTNSGDDGSPINQGTYGTQYHVDGETYFNPNSVVDGGTMVNGPTGGSFQYSKLGSAAHCAAGRTCW